MRFAIDALSLRQPHTGVQKALTGLLSGFAALVRDEDPSIAADDSFVVLAGRKAELPSLPDRFTVLRTFFRAENRLVRAVYQQFRLHGRVFGAGADMLHSPAYVAPRFAYLPVVLTMHDTFVFDFPDLCSRANVAHFRNIVPGSVKIARRIIAPSEYTKERLCRQFRDAEAKTRVIPFGVDEIFFAKDGSEWPLDEMPLPERFVLYVGGVEAKKNLETLVRAFFATALSKKLDTDLVIAGPDTGGEKRIRRLVEGLNFQQRVHFLGYVKSELLPALYRRADVFVFPSVAEGFGFPVLEAMASGVPVIASGIPALREIGGKAVRFYTPGHVASLREALEDVLGDKNHARNLAKGGAERAKLYTWEKCARATFDVYREACS